MFKNRTQSEEKKKEKKKGGEGGCPGIGDIDNAIIISTVRTKPYEVTPYLPWLCVIYRETKWLFI